ncbi:MAG: ATP-binding cassette domain-containing protein [Candidatus Diapherotrites archaeon]|nr:ATP-binding cassette domain-containing protein [Candidatus Diapherotrites archaeon]
MGSTIVEIRSLTKRFGKLTAVDAMNLDIQEGEIFGLLGPNGAGKTTTISMLSTTLAPTSGKALVARHDVVREQDAVRGAIGIVFQGQSLDTELTAYENLDFHARLYAVGDKETRIKEMLELVGLHKNRDTLVKNFSGGMKRRLEIARGLLHKPKVLFLDEPTLGLDPQTRRHIWEYVKRINREDGVTILLTTHYMEEADYLCGGVAIIDYGRIISLDEPQKLKSRLGETVLDFHVSDADAFCGLLKKNKCKTKKSAVGGRVQVVSSDGEELLPKLVSLAERNGVQVKGVSMHSSTLEDVFMQLTGRTIRDEAGNEKETLRQRFRAMEAKR